MIWHIDGKVVLRTGASLVRHLCLWHVRIYHEYEDGLENSVPSIALWHHEACRVMANGDARDWFFTIIMDDLLLTTEYHIYLYLKKVPRCFWIGWYATYHDGVTFTQQRRHLSIDLGLSVFSHMGKARIFYKLIYKPSYCNFLESRKKNISKIIFLFYCCLVEKLRFCLCILEI